MLTIFISIPWFHPAYKAGGPIQSIANMVEHFSENVIYKIFCSNTDLDNKHLKVITDKWTFYNKYTEIYYASYKLLSIDLLRREINKCNPDILFINGIYSWYFNVVPLLFCKAKKKIISVRGMLNPGALTQKKFKKKLFLKFWNLLQLHNRSYFHATNAHEKEFIQQIFGKKTKIFIAQNFPRIFHKTFPLRKAKGLLCLISIALISPMKNHSIILKALNKVTGNIVYNIYGPIKDAAYWKTCIDIIRTLPANVIVIYHGDIPAHDVEKALKESHVFILPSKSENFGHAIYEAFTAGNPVITSYNTPWNNLKASKAGINVDPENINEVVKAINFFTQLDAIKLEEWSSAANIYAMQAIKIDEIKLQYYSMFS